MTDAEARLVAILAGFRPMTIDEMRGKAKAKGWNIGNNNEIAELLKKLVSRGLVKRETVKWQIVSYRLCPDTVAGILARAKA